MQLNFLLSHFRQTSAPHDHTQQNHTAATVPPLAPSSATERLHGTTSTSYDQPGRRSVKCSARLTKKAKEKLAAEDAYDPTYVRPWKYLIPTMDEILNNQDWHLQVVDWTTFWGMFQNWVWVFSVLMDNRKEKGKMTSTVREQLIWLQIEPDIINGKIGKLNEVLTRVIDGMQDLIYLGYPVPERIEGKMPGFTGALQMKSTVDDRGRTQLDFGKAEGLMPLWDMTEPAPEEDAPKATTARPWDDWDEWEFRVYMEKRKAFRKRQADYAQRQSERRWGDTLVVSPNTDYRFAKAPWGYELRFDDPTHEELMSLVTRNGVNTDPTTIPVLALDPDEKPDSFAEGIHYAEDTMDFLRKIGHLTEREEDLVGEALESFASPTLDDEFGEGSEMSDLDTTLGDGGSDGLEAVAEGGMDDE